MIMIYIVSSVDSPIVLKNLRTLDITLDDVDIGDIYDHITVPAFNSLRINSRQF